MANRIAGIDSALIVVGPAGPYILPKISTHSLNLLRDVVEENYQNAKTPEFIEFSDGYSVKCDFHHDTVTAFRLFNDLDKKATREVDYDSFKVSAAFRYRVPGGAIIKIVVPDLNFGTIPIDMTARKALIKSGLDAKSSGPLGWFGL